MSLNEIITVSIDRNTTTPSAAGFGTPLLLGHFPTSIFPERVRTYTSLTSLEADGFKSCDPIHKMATALLAQNPSPASFKVGRRAGAPAQVITITPTDLTVGTVYVVKVTGTDAATFASRAATTDYATYTVVTSDTATDICNGLRASFGTPTGDFTAGGTATLTITANNTHATVNGQLFGVECHAGTANAAGIAASATPTIIDSTAVPGTDLQTDLAACYSYDPDFYAVAIDSNSAAEIADAAIWVEANKKLFVAQTQDTVVASTALSSDTTSIAYTLKNSARDYSALFFHRGNLDYVATAMLGRVLPEEAGSTTWAYKTLAGVSSQNLTANEVTNIFAKNANAVTTLASVSVTRYGTVASGEYADVIRGTAWLGARIQERVYTLLINNDKLPYTDAGIQAVRGEILAQLQAGVARDFIAASPEPTCTVPAAADVSSAEKGTRTLNSVTFRATLAGAIHKLAIEGELNL